jgi:hypothetical protein
LDALPLTGSRLIFTKSVEAAHRLARFLELSAEQAEADVDVLEISGSLSSERRAFVLSKMDVARAASPIDHENENGPSPEGIWNPMRSLTIADWMSETSAMERTGRQKRTNSLINSRSSCKELSGIACLFLG